MQERKVLVRPPRSPAPPLEYDLRRRRARLTAFHPSWPALVTFDVPHANFLGTPLSSPVCSTNIRIWVYGKCCGSMVIGKNYREFFARGSFCNWLLEVERSFDDAHWPMSTLSIPCPYLMQCGAVCSTDSSDSCGTTICTTSHSRN